MVNVTDISTTINELDTLYNNNPTQATYFSKLALLELCGWIEQSMDGIILDCSNANLTELVNRDFVKDNIVGRTYGFHYKEHFRPMLMKLVGLVFLEQIESRIAGDVGLLASQLGTLKANRDKVAHTTVTGVTHTYEAPSRMRQYLTAISNVLVKFDAELQAVNALFSAAQLPQSVQSAQPVQATQIAQITQSVQIAQSVQPTQVGQPVQPAPVTQPQVTQPQVAQAAQSAQIAQPVQPAPVVQPIQSAQVTQPQVEQAAQSAPVAQTVHPAQVAQAISVAPLSEPAPPAQAVESIQDSQAMPDTSETL